MSVAVDFSVVRTETNSELAEARFIKVANAIFCKQTKYFYHLKRNVHNE